MYPSDKMRQLFANRDVPSRLTRPAFILLGVAGALLFAMFFTITTTTELPLLEQKTQIFAWLVAAGSCVLVITIARGDTGLGLVVISSGLLIAKTGMQLDVGALRTSVLELLIVIATILIFLRRSFTTAAPQWPHLFLDRSFLLFVLLTLPAVFIALMRDVPGMNIFTEVKGYYLYPCLAYLIVSWARNQRRWQMAALIALIASLVIAAIAIWGWYFSSPGTAKMLTKFGGNRTSGSFGIINQYSFYVSTMVLLAFGLMIGVRRRFLVPVFAAVAALLTLAMALSGSRAGWIGLGVGLVVFVFFRPPRKIVWVPVIVIAAGVFFNTLPSIQQRLLLNPGSDQFRSSMLSLGLQIFLNYPLLGGGWGASFYERGGILEPANGLPWLHNDYLNLICQVGIIGFIPFILIWGRVITRSVRHIRTTVSPDLKWPMVGCLAALVALLVEAATDHVFWRPDIAGQVWWLTGMLLAGMELGKLRNSNETPGSY